MNSFTKFASRAFGVAASTAVILGGTSFAQCPADDATTTNNDCASAAAGTLGATVTGLSAQDVAEDWWTYVVPSGNDITIDMNIFNGIDVDLGLFDDVGTCGNQVDGSGSTTAFESVSYSNLTAAPVTVTLRVFLFSGTCADYDLTATVVPTTNPCFVLPADSEEENDDCLSAVVPSANPLPMLNVSKTDEDWYSFTVNAGEILSVDALHIAVNGDIDIDIVDTADCATVLADGATGSDNEPVVWNNTTGAAVNVAVRVFLWDGDDVDCNPDYTFTSSIMVDPCLAAVDDMLEDNDTCLTAGASVTAATGLFVSQADEDYYSYSLMAGEILDVNAAYLLANGDVDIELLDGGDCVTVLESDTGSFADDASLTYNNTTGAAQTVVLRVFVDAASTSGCNTYDLSTTIMVDPCTVAVDDMFEENDDCLSASPVTAGLISGLFVRKEGVDEDWYSTDVLDGATITVTCSFINDDGDIDIDLFDACGGTLLEGSAGIADTEDVTWTNGTGATVNVKWGVFVWSGDPTEDCNNYDMDVDIQGGAPTNLIPYCFGDGSGTPLPCGNNSTAGHAGGCANSAGDGAILVATGNPTVGADTLNLDLFSASPSSFALLVSGINQLPQMGACIGCGLPAFDGLRCAGGDFQRHGSRATDANGDTGNGWGPPGGPPGGLIAFNGFMAGQTRNFFAFYRDDMAQVCQTGQNSSNGVQITFN